MAEIINIDTDEVLFESDDPLARSGTRRTMAASFQSSSEASIRRSWRAERLARMSRRRLRRPTRTGS
jgi:hypothetical protein